jgi:hypothetical protein
MPNDDTSSIIDKKFFTVRNVGVIALCVFSCASAWGALSHRIDKEKAVNELQEIKHIEHDTKIDKNKLTHDADMKESEEDLKREIYNSKQLTYRITSAQQKQLDALIISDMGHKIRYEYIKESLKEIKEGQQ